MKAITIRGVEPEVAEKLKTTAKKQGKCVNHLILEFKKINNSITRQRQIDPELWK